MEYPVLSQGELREIEQQAEHYKMRRETDKAKRLAEIERNASKAASSFDYTKYCEKKAQLEKELEELLTEKEQLKLKRPIRLYGA